MNWCVRSQEIIVTTLNSVAVSKNITILSLTFIQYND